MGTEMHMDGRRTQCMLELIGTNKTKHPRFAIRVWAKDGEPCIRIASPDNSGELVAQGAHRVHVPKFDYVYVTIRLWRVRGALVGNLWEKVERLSVRHR